MSSTMAAEKSCEDTTSYISDQNKESLKNVVEKNEPKSEEDLLVLVAHAVLLQNGFKLRVPHEDDNTTKMDDKDGTVLPVGWNNQGSSDCYELSYINTKTQTLFTLRALLIEEKLCFNLLEQGKSYHHTTEAQVIVNDHVTRKEKPANYEWLNDPGFLWKLIEKGLLGKHQDLYEKRDEEMHIKLIEQERPRETERMMHPMVHDGVPMPPPDVFSSADRFQRPSPFAYGDADRLPGHPGMGGMMMDPLRSGGMGLRPPSYPGIPRGSVPPGARFDPFGPLTEFDYSSGDRRPRHSFDPNPDHLRRPGFNDDMFM